MGRFSGGVEEVGLGAACPGDAASPGLEARAAPGLEPPLWGLVAARWVVWLESGPGAWLTLAEDWPESEPVARGGAVKPLGFGAGAGAFVEATVAAGAGGVVVVGADAFTVGPGGVERAGASGEGAGLGAVAVGAGTGGTGA